ncbi:hypothetical protein FE257_000619 [Aspergillus nanangensis]|uniref:S-adenosyl-L-methionine-dependent methyltransferase n=1 Tax=Aspergillus nanangensis TaxID=2582783 RepID=A0AAD4CER9_ASPNN|nr:hypothetical protein FE257_000619 [Aspergillus nanangensis]
MAKSYNTDFADALKLLYREVQSRRQWASNTWTDTGAEQEVKMLEYACGPGTVSLALAPFVSKVVGLDVSEGMVNEYNKNAREAGFAEKMAGHKGDLLADTVSAEISGPEFSDFDIVCVSMALHHFEDPELALKRVAERLKKGGVSLIVDLVPDHNHEHHSHELKKDFPAVETIKTHGFTAEDMRKLYESAGLGLNFDYQVFEEPFVFHKNGKTHSKTIFIARAERQ